MPDLGAGPSGFQVGGVVARVVVWWGVRVVPWWWAWV